MSHTLLLAFGHPRKKWKNWHNWIPVWNWLLQIFFHTSLSNFSNFYLSLTTKPKPGFSYEIFYIVPPKVEFLNSESRCNTWHRENVLEFDIYSCNSQCWCLVLTSIFYIKKPATLWNYPFISLWSLTVHHQLLKCVMLSVSFLYSSIALKCGSPRPRRVIFDNTRYGKVEFVPHRFL